MNIDIEAQNKYVCIQSYVLSLCAQRVREIRICQQCGLLAFSIVIRSKAIFYIPIVMLCYYEWDCGRSKFRPI